ncbi:hypothetical protein E8E12_009381 [Didymella heteroderae]|uniref:Uncharacterized protein n=1 Tax=Didymella heteroderae TaxID=1769908 RepID=A0A9P4WRC6_9PLEO|nr:hypothetical protein E8E12_009381 [Didymella heteroderae]
MSRYPGYAGAGADLDDSGFFEQDDVGKAQRVSLLEFTAYGGGYNAFEEPQQQCGEDVEVEEGVFFNDAFVQENDFSDTLSTSSTPPPALSAPSPAPSEALSNFSAASLTASLDDGGLTTLRTCLTTPTTTLTPSTYAPDPLILANQPPAPLDPNALYAPLTTSRFKTSAAAKAHRKRARLAPKSAAADVTKVKAFGRDYWVVRIYNAMINSTATTDGAKSVHRVRFATKAAFDPLDLEAAAHAVLDEAIAVHERGWNRSTVYHKHTVRGKLVDISGASLELRLSRICLVLGETKSAVDDAVRGGVTLALLCDNPEARRFTKESNNLGNRKRSERLKQTSATARSKARRVEAAQDDEKVEDVAEIEEEGDESEAQELVDSRDVAAVQKVEE